MPDFSPGSEFAGHRIDGEIKRGGMGVVYRATDLRLKRTVALKVIAPELARGDDFRARFEREWSVAATIDHPNVIPVFHAGEEDGVLYTTMLLVDGLDLGDLIAKEGPLSLPVAAEIVAQIGSGLDAAHEQGLIHRDVKPGNILLKPTGNGYRAYLSDFGLTKRVDGRTALTMSGMFVGTVDYIAPEQLLGTQIDARTDVYSLGCVLYHALIGTAPYRGSNDWATLKAHESGEIPAPSDQRPELGGQIDEVIKRALAKSPDDRYPSAGDLGRAGLAAAAERPVSVPEASVARGDAAEGIAETGAPPPGGLPPEQPMTQPESPVPPGGPPRQPKQPGNPSPLVIGGLAVIAVALLAGVLAVAGVFGGGGGGGGEDTTATHERPPKEEPGAALNIAQVEAAEILHEPFRQSCEPAESDASVECKVRDFDITLSKFDSLKAMNSNFIKPISSLPDEKSCDDAWNVRDNWYNDDPDKPQGKIACYESVDKEEILAWTSDRLLVEGFIIGTAPSDRDKLYEVWQEDTTD